MKGRMLAALAAVAVLCPLAAVAATGPKVGPKNSWTDMQKFEYYIGQAGGALNICGNYGLSAELKKLADLSPYGRKGWQSMQSFDGIRGGHCGPIAADAEKILADRDKLYAYLTENYDCPGGFCAPEDTEDSSSATCRPEVDEYLSSLAVPVSDVRSVKLVGTQNTYVINGKKGYQAWIRLESCTGWLIIELTKGCTPRQSYTRGECSIEKIKAE